MVDMTYPELASDLGTATADSLRNIANAAANTVCNVYENYPSGILPSVGSSPPGQFTDALLRRLCAPRGQTPPAQAQPFSGGQCPTLYRVVVYVGDEGVTPGPVVYRRVSGPIVGITERPNNDFPENKDVVLTVGPARPGADWIGSFIIGANFPGNPTAYLGAITREDFSPDTCGDPAPVYPPSTGPTNNYNTNNPITIGGNSVNVPITIVPTLFQPVNIFRPELTVRVGPVDVNFNLGGINFYPNFAPDIDVKLPGNDPRKIPPTPTKPKDPVSKGVDLTPVIDLLEDIKECACKPNKVLKTLFYGLSAGREIELPADTVSVLVNTTILGSKVKMEVGEGSARDVLYLGWYSFGFGSDPGQRIPLNFQRVNAIAPENATHFVYSLNFNSQATLTVNYMDEP